MTLLSVINLCDSIKPNAFSVAAKSAWLSEVEGMIYTEVYLLQPEEFTPLPADGTDAPLTVRPPHDSIYQYYLCAMIDFANGEYSKYQNTLTMFNQKFGEFCRWFSDNLRPAEGQAIRRGYYLSAYGIAVMHGYIGTEAQWLASLKGDTGEPGKGFVLLGFYPTEELLEASVANPDVGDTYGVGTEAPYEIYSWNGSGWVDLGDLRGERGLPGDPGQPGAPGTPGNPGVWISDSEDDPPPNGETVWIIRHAASEGDPGLAVPVVTVERTENGVKIIADSAGSTTEAELLDGPPGRSIAILGFLADVDGLDDIDDPQAGDIYAVGTAAPYTLWCYDGLTGDWVSMGAVIGIKGDPGDPGQPGAAGYSPSAEVTKSGKVITISITDADGTTTAEIDEDDIVADVLSAMPTWTGGSF